MNRSNVWYPFNEETYADIVCLDCEETKAIFKWLRKKGLDSQEIVTNAIGCFAMITLLTDEEKAQISDVMGKLGDRLKKAIDEMTEGLSDKPEKYVKLSDILELVEDSICDLESNTDKDMFIASINKLETKKLK